MKDYEKLLEYHGNNMTKSIENSVENLNKITANTSFQLMHYATSATEVHENAYEMLPSLQSFAKQDPSVGGYFLYDTKYSYYCPVFQRTYSYPDQALIKEFLTRKEYPLSIRNIWIPLSLSDRTVLLRLSGFDTTVCALMLDPSSDDIVKSSFMQMNPKELFFYSATNTGTPFLKHKTLEEHKFLKSRNKSSLIELDEKKWHFLLLPLDDGNLSLCCLISYKSIWFSMNNIQKLLLFSIIILFFYNAYTIIHILYSSIVSPLDELSNMMLKISSGSLDLRIPENQKITEYLHLSKTFNQMLDNIQHLKIESYTKQLDLQQSQLQYLQLQIRPHFYLNCLKGLYSLAEKEEYSLLQESILSLADYFRYMFKNNHNFVTFSDEIHAISSYLKLQKLNFSRNPKITMDIPSNAADFPLLPLSVLTFVENSIKHSGNQKNILIHIHAALLTIENQTILNITISDNCGGFSDDALNTLNHLEDKDFLYQEYHVGIYNVYYRMKLVYENKAVLAFYNNTAMGGTVELFIPMKKEEKIE